MIAQPMYRVIKYDSGPEGMDGMQALINEHAAEGYELFQAVYKTTYDWVLIFRKEAWVRIEDYPQFVEKPDAQP